MGKPPLLAAHHWSFYDLSIEDACEHARELGYEGLDLGVGDFGSGPRVELPVIAGDQKAMAQIRGVAESSGIRFTDFVVAVISVPGMSQADRDTAFGVFERFATHGREMGITGVTVLPGFYESDWQEAFDLVAVELRRYMEAASSGGLALSIEPHLESVVDSPERTLQMLETVEGLTLTLDYSHFVYGGFSHEEIEPLDVFARHIHARQAAPGHLSTSVDDGVIDYHRLLSHLKAIDYEGALTTEYVESEWYAQDAVDSTAENARMRDVLVGLRAEVWT